MAGRKTIGEKSILSTHRVVEQEERKRKKGWKM